MIEASCHCGSVRPEVDAPPPEVAECNRSIRRRYGVPRACYPPDRVRVSTPDPPTDAYAWGSRSIWFRRCRTCGCVSHWAAVGRGRDRTGVNARLVGPAVLAGARGRHLDGAHTEEYTD